MTCASIIGRYPISDFNSGWPWVEILNQVHDDNRFMFSAAQNLATIYTVSIWMCLMRDEKKMSSLVIPGNDGDDFCFRMYGLMMTGGDCTVEALRLTSTLSRMKISSEIDWFWIMIPFATFPLPESVEKSLLSQTTVDGMLGEIFLGQILLHYW